MTKYQIEMLDKVNEKYKDDEDVQRLVKSYEAYLDDGGERDEWYAKQLEDYVNRCPRDEDKFTDYLCYRAHRYLQGEVIKLILKLIDKWGSLEDRFTDGRNESYVKIMKKVREFCKEENFV